MLGSLMENDPFATEKNCNFHEISLDLMMVLSWKNSVADRQILLLLVIVIIIVVAIIIVVVIIIIIIINIIRPFFLNQRSTFYPPIS